MRSVTATRPSPAVTPVNGRLASLLVAAHASIDVVYREIVKFGAVGAVAFVVDFGVFNLLRTGIIGGSHGFPEKPLTAKTISVFAATIVAWLGNRYWTFRRRRRASRHREFALFGIMNIGGLIIALSCLAFSHYALGLTSALADNIAGNVIGLGLGTLFRFWAYRRFVFIGEAGFTQELGVDPDGRIHTGELDLPSARGRSRHSRSVQGADQQPQVAQLAQPPLVGGAENHQAQPNHREQDPGRQISLSHPGQQMNQPIDQ